MRANAARHPDHDAGVALPDALLAVREILAGGRGGDRRRDPRRRPVQARLAPGADPGAARAPGRAERAASPTSSQRIGLSATQRPLERIAQFLVGPKRECEIVDAGTSQGARPGDRRAGRGHGGPGRSQLPQRGRRPPTDRDRAARPTCARSGRRSTRSCWSWSSEHTSTIIFVNNRRAAERLAKRLNELANERRRAGAPGDRARRATTRPARKAPPRTPARTRSTRRRDRPRPPRLALPRGADRGRGAAQVRAAALPGRDLLAGARHRHGRRRPGDPGRVAEVGQPRPAAGRPRRPLARRGLAGPDLPQVPRRPARVRGRRQAHARRARSRRR